MADVEPQHEKPPRQPIVLGIGLFIVLVAALVPAWWALLSGGDPTSADTALASLTAATVQAFLAAVVAYATVRYASLTEALLNEAAKQRTIGQQQLDVAQNQVAVSQAQVEMAGEELAVTKAAVESQSQPWLAEVPPDAEGPAPAFVRLDGFANAINVQNDRTQTLWNSNSNTHAGLSLAIRNVGAGPARIEAATLEGAGSSVMMRSTHVVLPVGEIGRVTASVEAATDLGSHLDSGGDVVVRVRYSSVPGARTVTTTFSLAKSTKPNVGHVVDVSYVAGGDG